MNVVLKGLEPTLVWEYFEKIAKIPRCSGKEEKICSYLISFAKKNKLSYKKDKVGNVLIKKNASVGKENSKTIILQAHVDMVCEKEPNIKFNFDKEPIQLRRNNDWLSAKGTTLGADNGIGVAMMLSVLSDNTLIHGPLECLFTVSEETGLYGAKGLKKGVLFGGCLINLDFGDDKEFCIGSAGAEGFFINKKITRIKSNKDMYLEISVSGLLGGHSGVDINKNRGNSIKIITRLLNEFKFNFEICSFDAGNKLNAIPRDAKVVIGIDKKDYDVVISAAKN
jgi:dipeptidase D